MCSVYLKKSMMVGDNTIQGESVANFFKKFGRSFAKAGKKELM